MRWGFVALIAVAAPVLGQTAPAPDAAIAGKIPDDLNLLAGKKVVVGRLPLCVPNTYTVNLTYAGKPATVVSYAPNAMLARYRTGMSRMPAGARATMEDARRGGKLTFRFEDGTVLDSCGDMMLSQLAPNLELAPGETIVIPAVAANAPAPGGVGAQECPLAVASLSSGLSFGHALVDALTNSRLQTQIDEAENGGVGKNYLDVRVRNDSKKAVKAFEYTAVYRDAMGDETTSPTYVSQNTQPIKPGAFFKSATMDRVQRSQTGRGDVKVYISRVRFDGDSMWEDNGSRSCSAMAASK